MKILIDIGHPGHVHLFRPFAQEMTQKGVRILFTCREKEFETDLLRASGLSFVSMGRHFKSKAGKLFGLVWFSLRLFFIGLKFRPDIYLSHGSIYAGVVAWLSGKVHVSLEDSGNMEQVRLYLPFTRYVITPDMLEKDLGRKQLKYNGYHEIAYLHPRYFSPDTSIFRQLKLPENASFALIRLVSWNATHDFRQSGLSADTLYRMVDYLKLRMPVFISSEGTVPEGLEKYIIKIRPEQIHSVIFHSRIVISEGATIASEAGVLGTPAIYVNSISRCYNEDQETYGTVINLRNDNNLLETVKRIVEDENYKFKTRESAKKMVNEKIDLTRLLVWFIDGYPATTGIYKRTDNHGLKEILERV